MARLVRKDRRVPLARTEQTAHKAPPVLKVLLAHRDRKATSARRVRSVPLVRLALKVRRVTSVLKVRSV
jgi:hypothetical protein